jgi:hypothetical protein
MIYWRVMSSLFCVDQIMIIRFQESNAKMEAQRTNRYQRNVLA